MNLVDSHCHIGEEEYDADRAEVLERARRAGVSAFIVAAAGGALDTNVRAVELARRESDCHAVIGIHPHHASEVDDEIFGRLSELAQSEAVVGIGEAGLDFHYDHSPRERQKTEFRRFVGLARARRLPLVIHSRKAADETEAILREEAPDGVPGVMHCFTYGAAEARRFLDLGLYVSFSGIVTFRNAEDVREAARLVPFDRMLVETDSPFLSPEPKRGGRNEPARVADVVVGLAKALGRPAEEVAAQTAENARRLFLLAASSSS